VWQCYLCSAKIKSLLANLCYFWTNTPRYGRYDYDNRRLTFPKIFFQIIREKTPSESQKLITAIFYLLAQHQDILVQKVFTLALQQSEYSYLLQLQSKLQRFHTQLLHLLAQFRLKDTWLNSETYSTLALDTLNNLLQYCVCLTFNGGMSFAFCSIKNLHPFLLGSSTIFSPTMKIEVSSMVFDHLQLFS
jgi:hypothetical protein